MGIETEEPIISDESFRHNFTNEGGIDGTTRFLKNITGMWLLEQCRKEWEKAGRDYSYPAIVKMAERATPFRCFVNPDDPRFANPPSMTEAIRPIAARRGSRSLRKMTSLSVVSLKVWHSATRRCWRYYPE